MIIHAIIIATRLVRKRIQLHRPTDRFSNPIPIPTTARGGTNDAAIATHASPAAIFLNPKARKATHHDAKAIPKSIRVGCVLIKISFVSSERGISQVMRMAETIHTRILVIKSHNHFQKSLLFHVVVANATA